MPRAREIVRLSTLPCADVARLVSDGLDRRLPPGPCLAVWLHLVYCSACRRYRRQVVFLRRAMGRFPGDWQGLTPAPASVALPPEARERIRRSLGGK